MKSESRRGENLKWIALIAFVAIVLRVYAIDRLPPGLFGDEAVEGLDALDVLAGNFYIWFHAHLGREPLFVYLVAASYKFLGVTPFATRLPALVVGLLTLPGTFFFAREWARGAFANDDSRATRIALLTTGLLAISFWDIQMNRNAHRDNLVPLVEVIGYYLLWRGIRASEWRFFAAAGAILGLSIYTYSPGRFVGVFIAIFFAVEFVVARLTGDSGPKTNATNVSSIPRLPSILNLGIAAICAVVVILPLGIYFATNPDQFVRRFDSASIFNAPQPVAALGESVVGNLAQFIIPGAGYQSKHYNLPGKPVFDLFLAPWFLGGLVLACVRLKNSAYRFLLLWFVVMLTPPFLTSDMIPKGVRGLGTMPGVLMFIAVAMDWAINYKLPITNDKARNTHFAALALIAITLIGTTLWTTFDYFVTWANLPELPIAFDSDYAETAAYVRALPPAQPIYLSAEVYRHPTYMLLGEQLPTSRYLERGAHVREFDATAALVTHDPNAVTIFVRDQSPPEDWYRRLAPKNERIDGGAYFAAYRLREIAPPQVVLNNSISPLITLVGVSRFADDPPGIALYWRVAALPSNRTDTNARVTLLDARSQVIAQKEHRFGYPAPEWGLGESVVEWYEFDSTDNATQFTVELTRGDMNWKSQAIPLK